MTEGGAKQQHQNRKQYGSNGGVVQVVPLVTVRRDRRAFFDMSLQQNRRHAQKARMDVSARMCTHINKHQPMLNNPLLSQSPHCKRLVTFVFASWEFVAAG